MYRTFSSGCGPIERVMRFFCVSDNFLGNCTSNSMIKSPEEAPVEKSGIPSFGTVFVYPGHTISLMGMRSKRPSSVLSSTVHPISACSKVMWAVYFLRRKPTSKHNCYERMKMKNSWLWCRNEMKKKKSYKEDPSLLKMGWGRS